MVQVGPCVSSLLKRTVWIQKRVITVFLEINLRKYFWTFSIIKENVTLCGFHITNEASSMATHKSIIDHLYSSNIMKVFDVADYKGQSAKAAGSKLMSNYLQKDYIPMRF